MEVALGAANWLLGQVLNKLSDDLVKAYVSSTELGLNLVEIRKEMLYTKGLLEAAQGRDFAENSGLKGLLEDLSKKADEADDALDELHYFIIQDKLDGTQDATPDLGDGLGAQAQHARHAAQYTADVLAAVARTKTMPTGSFQLVSLTVDSISAVLVAPICSHLSATLQKLYFGYDRRTEKFTEEQDEALRLLMSLQDLCFYNCRALQSLPQGLHRLPSLQELRIWGTQKIRSLPKEGLPDSLRLLRISNCCAEIYEECQKLRGTRPDINIVASIPDMEG